MTKIKDWFMGQKPHMKIVIVLLTVGVLSAVYQWVF